MAAGVPLLFRRARVIGKDAAVLDSDTFGGEIHLAAHAARRHSWAHVLATLYGDAALRDADGALLADLRNARPMGNVDPLALEKTVARVWDKDRAMRLAELRRDPYLPGWEERRHDKVISEAVLGPTVS